MVTELWDGPLVIAHRGSRLLWPENTMEAFQGASELGVRHLETDLRMTSDGVLVCFHDEWVDRTTNGTGPISRMTWDEVSALDAGYRHDAVSGFPFRGGKATVPAFEEVVSEFPDAGLIVDLKAEGMAEELAGLIERHGLHDRIIVGSFSDRRLAEFRAASGGTVPTSVGQAEARRWVIAARMRRAISGDAAALQLPMRARGVVVIDERLVGIAQDAGLYVHVWTVNQVEDMEYLLGLGVDGIITDRPDVLDSVISEGTAP